MISMDEKQLIETLKVSYEKVMMYKHEGKKEGMLKMIGWCNAIENIVFKFSPENKATILQMREEIMASEFVSTEDDDLDFPTYLRVNGQR